MSETLKNALRSRRNGCMTIRPLSQVTSMLRVSFALGLWCLSTSSLPVSTPANDTHLKGSRASDLFYVYRRYVFPLKTTLSEESPKESYGTAFVISSDGYLITNYHVVSDVVQHENRQLYLEIDKKLHRATIEGLDVIHDLALIKVDRKFPGQLTLSRRLPPQGTRLYSMGQPQDLNMSIIEGVYNGSLTLGGSEVFHLSSPLNGGMSGGPTIDETGQVLGINVAILARAQNISFAVPAKFAIELFTRAKQLRKKITTQPWMQLEIETQLLKLGHHLFPVRKPASEDRIQLSGWRFRKPPSYLQCWSTTEDEVRRDQSYQVLDQICLLPHSIFLDKRTSAGTYEIRYQVVTSDKLNPLQFSSLLSSKYNEKAELVSRFILNLLEESTLVTSAQCSEYQVVNSHGIQMTVNYCLRAYLPYSSIYDLDFKWVTHVRQSPGLIVKGTLRGLAKDKLRSFLEDELNSVEWKPNDDSKGQKR